MTESQGTIRSKRSQPGEILLSGAANSEHQEELSRAMQTVYERLKAAKSAVRARRRLGDEPPDGSSGIEIKSPVMAEILIAFIASGAAVAAVNAIASAIARSRNTTLSVCRDGEMICSISGKGFSDSSQVERLAAQMIKSDVELRIHVDDPVQVEG